MYVYFLEDIVLMDLAAGNIPFDLALDVLDALDRANVHLANARNSLSTARLLHGIAITYALDLNFPNAAFVLSECRADWSIADFERNKAETDIGDAETLLWGF